MTDIELNKPKPSPPMYYRLESPERLKSVNVLSPKTILLLEVLGYMAMQDVDPLNRVLDAMKVFSINKYISEAGALPPSKLSNKPAYSTYFSMRIQHGLLDWDKRYLDEIFDKGYGEISEMEIDENITNHIGMAVLLSDHLEDYYSSYYEAEEDPYKKPPGYYDVFPESRILPERAMSRPDKVNVLHYPSLRAVMDFLERHSAVPEVNTVLPILYILTGQIDKAIDSYRSRDSMDYYDCYNFGTLYLIEKNDLLMARKQLGRNPMLIEAVYNLGVTYLCEEDWAEAGEYFEVFELLANSTMNSFIGRDPVAFNRYDAIHWPLNKLVA